MDKRQSQMCKFREITKNCDFFMFFTKLHTPFYEWPSSIISTRSQSIAREDDKAIPKQMPYSIVLQRRIYRL